VRYPYLVIDAHYEKVRREGRVLSPAALWVVGVREDGYREHLGVWSGLSDSRETWVRVFRDLVQRGHRRRGVRGQRRAPGAALQRCQVHYLRNALS
jgi:putative transposase